MAAHDLRNFVGLPGAAEEVERRRPRPKRLDDEEAFKVNTRRRGAIKVLSAVIPGMTLLKVGHQKVLDEPAIYQ